MTGDHQRPAGSRRNQRGEVFKHTNCIHPLQVRLLKIIQFFSCRCVAVSEHADEPRCTKSRDPKQVIPRTQQSQKEECQIISSENSTDRAPPPSPVRSAIAQVRLHTAKSPHLQISRHVHRSSKHLSAGRVAHKLPRQCSKEGVATIHGDTMKANNLARP